jgi:aryl-alcohol dehydrogenase-like predicted oxidoreductase
MIKIQVDLMYYFQSPMVLDQIPHSDEFVQFHRREDELYIPVNFMKNEPVDTIQQHYEYVEVAFQNKNMSDQVHQKGSACIRCKRCKKGRLAKQYSERNSRRFNTELYRETKVDNMFSDNSFGELWEISYEAVNMPMLLRNHPR